MTPNQTKQAGEDLAAAAQYIRDHGWTTGTLVEKDGPKKGHVCSLGAINAVILGDPAEALSHYHVAQHPRGKHARAWRAIKLLAQRIEACFPKEAYTGQNETSQVYMWQDDQKNRRKVLRAFEAECAK